MRIGIVANTSWNIYNFRRALISDLITEGYEVIIFAPKDDATEVLTTMGFNIIEVRNLERKGKNPFQDLKLKRELTSLYKRNKIDLAIHFTIKPNIYGSIAASSLNIPSIAVVTGLGYSFLSTGLASKIANRLYKFAFARNNKTIFQNEDDLNLFRELNLVKRDKSLMIPGSGIDEKYFWPMHNYQETYILVFVGRLLKDKGVFELLEGFTNYKLHHPDSLVKLQLVGDIDMGNPASLTKDIIDSYNNDDIEFVGFKKDVKPFIAQADAVILPSYREGLPRVILEAMSMAKPILVTDVAGCRQTVVDGENGFLIKEKNSQDIEDVIQKFYDLPIDKREKMGLKSRERIEKEFSYDIVNKKYIKLIKSLLANV